MNSRFLLFLFFSSAAVAMPIALPAIPSAVSAVKVAIGATSATVGALAADKTYKVLSSDDNTATIGKHELKMSDYNGNVADATVRGIVDRSTALNSLRENYGKSGLGSSASSSSIASAILPHSNRTTREDAAKILDGLRGGSWAQRSSSPRAEEKAREFEEATTVYGYRALNGSAVYADSRWNACTLAGGTPLNGGLPASVGQTVTSCNASGITLQGLSSRTIPADNDCVYFMGPNMSGFTCGVPPTGTVGKEGEALIDEFGAVAPMSVVAGSTPRDKTRTVPETFTIGDTNVTITTSNTIVISRDAADAKAAEENPPEPPTETMEDTFATPDIPTKDFEFQISDFFSFPAECPKLDTLDFGRFGTYNLDLGGVCQTLAAVSNGIIALASLSALAILKG